MKVNQKPTKRLRYIIADAERAREYRESEFAQDFERPIGLETKRITIPEVRMFEEPVEVHIK